MQRCDWASSFIALCVTSVRTQLVGVASVRRLLCLLLHDMTL